MHDLESKIADWRNHLRDAESVTQDTLDELEEHLRDSIAELMASGLTGDEAVLIASRRLGDSSQLAHEFHNATPLVAWKRRVLCGVSGYVIGCAFASLVAGLSTFAAVGFATMGVSGTTVGIGSVIMSALAWCGLFAACSRLSSQHLPLGLVRIPYKTLAIGLVLALVGGRGIEGVGRAVIAHVTDPSTFGSFVVWATPGSIFVQVAVFAVCLTISGKLSRYGMLS